MPALIRYGVTLLLLLGVAFMVYQMISDPARFVWSLGTAILGLLAYYTLAYGYRE